jgi:hypothetical protein
LRGLFLLAIASLELEIYPETVRFDLEKGTLIEQALEPPIEELRIREPVRIAIAKDEVVAFQVLVRGSPGVVPVSVTGLEGLRAELFREVGIRVASASESVWVHSLGPAMYPDPLVPTATVSVPEAPGVALVWIDLWAPLGAKDGESKGELHIGDRSIAIEIEVLPLALPREDVARIGAVNFGSMLNLAHERMDLQRSWVGLAHAHRMAIEIMLTRPARGAGGALDWEAWAARYGPYVDGSAFTEGPRAGVPITRFVIPLSDNWPSPRTEEKLPSDVEGWGRELKRWERLAIDRKWFDIEPPTDWILFINSLDEPKTAAQLESLTKWRGVIDRAQLQDRRHVRFRIDGPFNQGVEGWSDERILEELGPVVDLWNVCGATHWTPWQLLEKRVRDVSDERLMFYASNTAGEPATPPIVIDAPLTNARAWGWIIRRYRLDGALNWEIDFAAGCPENPRCADPKLNLDANLIYRGHELGRAWYEPIPSMRLKALRRGAQDVALVALLEAEDPLFASEIVEGMVPYAMGDGVPNEGPGLWPKRTGRYLEARAAILERLARKKGASATLERTLLLLGVAAAVVIAVLLIRRRSR